MKNLQVKLLLALCLAFGAYESNAQEMIRLRESMGLPLRSRTYEELKGNPYFTTGWSVGLVKQSDGKIFKDVQVKYDQLEDQLTFKAENNTELGFAVPVVEFKLTAPDGTSHLFRNGFEPLKGIGEKNYYEILHDGHVKLLKRNSKDIKEFRAYNSAVTTKTVTDHINYYYAIDNKVYELKRNVKELDGPFGAKAAAVAKYIKDNKLGLKTDEDLTKIFLYHSSL